MSRVVQDLRRGRSLRVSCLPTDTFALLWPDADVASPACRKPASAEALRERGPVLRAPGRVFLLPRSNSSVLLPQDQEMARVP